MFKQLWFQVLLGMVLGVLFGLILSPSAFALVPESLAFGIAPWVALVGSRKAMGVIASQTNIHDLLPLA